MLRLRRNSIRHNHIDGLQSLVTSENILHMYKFETWCVFSKFFRNVCFAYHHIYTIIDINICESSLGPDTFFCIFFFSIILIPFLLIFNAKRGCRLFGSRVTCKYLAGVTLCIKKHLYVFKNGISLIGISSKKRVSWNIESVQLAMCVNKDQFAVKREVWRRCDQQTEGLHVLLPYKPSTWFTFYSLIHVFFSRSHMLLQGQKKNVEVIHMLGPLANCMVLNGSGNQGASLRFATQETCGSLQLQEV